MTARSVQEARASAVLNDLTIERGSDVLSDAHKLEALLNDVLGQEVSELRREIKLLSDAADAQVASVLIASGPGTFTTAESRLTTMGVEAGSARWAVTAFADALGVEVPLSSAALSGSQDWAPPQVGAVGGQQVPVSAPPKVGNGFSTAGIVLGVLALIILPILLGPIGIGLGALGKKRGETKGQTAMIVAACGTVVGMFLAYLVLSA